MASKNRTNSDSKNERSSVFSRNVTRRYKYALFSHELFVSGMVSATDECATEEHVCAGECLHQVELFEDDEDDEDDDDENSHNNVCQFISMDCPAADPCVPQPCANFELCGNRQPQWVLDCHGGLCVQPCDMMYGRIFEFSRSGASNVCPVCLEADAVSVVYPCRHMVCAHCYSATAFNDSVTLLLKRCPMCRLDGVPLGSMRRGRHSGRHGEPIIDF